MKLRTLNHLKKNPWVKLSSKCVVNSGVRADRWNINYNKAFYICGSIDASHHLQILQVAP